MSKIFLTDTAESSITDEIINIGSGQTYSVNHLVELLSDDVVYIPKRPGETYCTWADIGKSIAILVFNPQTNINDGIPKFINWYRAYYV